jgi:hypothetical protein
MACPSNSSIESAMNAFMLPSDVHKAEQEALPMSKSLRIKRHNSSVSLSSNEENMLSSSNNSGTGLDNGVLRSDSDDFGAEEDDEWIPHCFVKTTRSKEVSF